MSRRRRCARRQVLRSRVARAKRLRRRARLSGVGRAAGAAAVAAVALAGVAAPTEAVPTGLAGGVGENLGVFAGGALLSRCTSPHTPGSSPSDLTDVGGRLFFAADDGPHGGELWKSDGTEAGTVMVKNIGPRTSHGGVSSLTEVEGRLFFTAADGTHGDELWKSDGTRVGTVLVKDIDPGRGSYPSSYPSILTEVGGRLFFSADEGTHGRELWKSDGTRAGTVLVADINPGASYSPPPRYGSIGPSDLTDMGGDPVLQRQRRHPRPGAVEVRWHRGRHGPGRRHQPRLL